MATLWPGSMTITGAPVDGAGRGVLRRVEVRRLGVVGCRVGVELDDARVVLGVGDGLVEAADVLLGDGAGAADERRLEVDELQAARTQAATVISPTRKRRPTPPR